MPTQPPTLSGMENEYQPICGEAMRLGSKGRMAHFICGCTCRWQVKLCDPSVTHTIPERSVVSQSAIQMSSLLYFTSVLGTQCCDQVTFTLHSLHCILADRESFSILMSMELLHCICRSSVSQWKASQVVNGYSQQFSINVQSADVNQTAEFYFQWPAVCSSLPPALCDNSTLSNRN